MGLIRLRFLFLACCVAAALSLHAGKASAQGAQWYVEVLPDPISGNPVLEARVLTNLGYHFYLRRREDNAIWAHFRLPRADRTQLTTRPLPRYWIDENDPVDLEELKRLEVGFTPTLYRHDEKELDFIVWGAANKGFVPPILRQMMLGEKMFVKYWTFDGEQGLAEIPLRRANEAIAQFLGVPPLDKSPERERVREIDFSLIAKHFLEICDELRFSGDDGAYGECRDQFALCSEKPEQTAQSLTTCLEFDP